MEKNANKRNLDAFNSAMKRYSFIDQDIINGVGM